MGKQGKGGRKWDDGEAVIGTDTKDREKIGGRVKEERSSSKGVRDKRRRKEGAVREGGGRERER